MTQTTDTKKIVIKKGWYRTAGDQYKWVIDGHDVLGVGINRVFFEKGKKLIIKVAGKEYEFDCDEGREFINKYQSVMEIRSGRVGIVSKSLLKEL